MSHREEPEIREGIMSHREEPEIIETLDIDQIVTEDDKPVDNLPSEKQQRLLTESLLAQIHAEWKALKPTMLLTQGKCIMPRNFRTTMALICIILAVLLFSACGTTTVDAGDTTEETTKETTEASTGEESGQTEETSEEGTSGEIQSDETAATTAQEPEVFENSVFLAFIKIRLVIEYTEALYFDFIVDQEAMTCRGKATHAKPVEGANKDSRDPNDWHADETVTFGFTCTYEMTDETVITSDPVDIDASDGNVTVTITDAQVIATLGRNEEDRQTAQGTFSSEEIEIEGQSFPGVTVPIRGFRLYEDEIPDDLVRIE